MMRLTTRTLHESGRWWTLVHRLTACHAVTVVVRNTPQGSQPWSHRVVVDFSSLWYPRDRVRGICVQSCAACAMGLTGVWYAGRCIAGEEDGAGAYGPRSREAVAFTFDHTWRFPLPTSSSPKPWWPELRVFGWPRCLGCVWQSFGSLSYMGAVCNWCCHHGWLAISWMCCGNDVEELMYSGTDFRAAIWSKTWHNFAPSHNNLRYKIRSVEI